MWYQIALNKRNTYILLTVILLLLLVIGAAFGILFVYSSVTFEGENINHTAIMFQSAQIGVASAFVIWLILLISALTGGKDTFLSLNQAYKIPAHAHKILENVVEEMSIAAGLPKPPEIYVIDTPMPNAFATGINPQKSAVAVTTGLLTELDRDELQGVIAHEIAHIVNRDTMYMIFAGIMIGTILFLSEYGMKYFFRGGGRRAGRRSRNAEKAELIILIVCIILMIVSPIVAQLLYFSISQRREYLADACAAQFTRYPQGLASALAKISGSININQDFNKITSAMCIINPLKKEKTYKKSYSMFANAFSTHPPTAKRIEILSKMSGADINSYNEAFKKVSKQGQTILSKEFLYGVKPLEIIEPKTQVNIKTSNIVSGVVSGAALMSDKVQKEETQDKNYIKRTRKRTAEDIILKANDYIFKECTCGTKFKIPQEYKNMEFKCPHCKNLIYTNISE